jgi:UDP-2-acetamido-2-deoxy-ribo-hexuluronate aminotransferase
MKFLDLNLQYKSIKKEIDTAVKRVLDSGVFIGGTEVEKLEREVAKFCGVKYGVGVNSGTDALYLSLKALGIGSGDEVITSPFTFIATAEVIANLGARPVFIDIDPLTFNINPAKIERAITKKTKALVPVHLFGQTADMAEIMKIARRYKLKVVEDAAQVIGATYKGKRAGSIGEVGCFSFFPSKNLSACGDGGIAVTDNKKLAERIRLLGTHGSSPKDKYLNLILGTNSRLDALQAAILRVKLRHLPEWNKKRRENARYYDKKLKGMGDIEIPVVGSNRTHIFYQYTVRTKFRDELQKYLKKREIPTMSYYPLPLYLQPAFRYLRRRRSDSPEAEKAAREVLALPIHPELSEADRRKIVKTISEFF